MASKKQMIELTVNGVHREGLAEPRRTLADFLRDDLGLTGTHLGCEHGVCGACTVFVNGEGFVMSVYAFLKENPDPREEEIRPALSGNLCRCTGYQNIVNAVRLASEKMQAAASEPVPVTEQAV